MFQIALFAILFVCVAMLFSRGLWRNMITLINVILAALLATNYFEPLAEVFKGKAPSFDYMWDFLAIWLLFAGSMGALRVITDRLSLVRVRFIKQLDLAGGVVFSLWAGWILMCFTAMTLHLAPVQRNAVERSPSASDFMFSPDRLWLGFMQAQSYRALGRAASPDDAAYVFDPKSDLILRYAASRKQFEDHKEFRTDNPKGRASSL
ncbi:MAG TPA: CvpA family protein [Pirellulales bacterium]|jgi:uncharacterized membrane protein required for colicin V production|nr:CvpA family protein [Pirellulales bacterium]